MFEGMFDKALQKAKAKPIGRSKDPRAEAEAAARREATRGPGGKLHGQIAGADQPKKREPGPSAAERTHATQVREYIRAVDEMDSKGTVMEGKGKGGKDYIFYSESGTYHIAHDEPNGKKETYNSSPEMWHRMDELGISTGSLKPLKESQEAPSESGAEGPTRDSRRSEGRSALGKKSEKGKFLVRTEGGPRTYHGEPASMMGGAVWSNSWGPVWGLTEGGSGKRDLVHIPSGQWVMRGASMEQADFLVHELDELDIDWESDEPLNTENRGGPAPEAARLMINAVSSGPKQPGGLTEKKVREIRQNRRVGPPAFDDPASS